jgi:hypothetical protein
VFAGYGSQQVFPSCQTWIISGRLEGGVRAAVVNNQSVSPLLPAVILPIAQQDLIKAFMEGINPGMRDMMDVVIENLVNRLALNPAGRQELVDLIADRLNEMRTTNSKPVLDGVSYLSAYDLANLAHSLVAYTAMHNRVSLTPDTVGGPFDVALVSRADGFVWIEEAAAKRRSSAAAALGWSP